MSGSSAVPSSISRLEEDGSQPSPKRRKNSSTKSRENGFNNISSNSEPTSSLPPTCPDATATKGVDNGNIVSSTSTATTTTTPKERDTAATETTPKSVSGTEVVNGDVTTKAVNANEEKVESKSKSANGQAEAEKKDQSLRRNQFGEVSDGHMALEDWLEQWRKGKTRFTMKVPNRSEFNFRSKRM